MRFPNDGGNSLIAVSTNLDPLNHSFLAEYWETSQALCNQKGEKISEISSWGSLKEFAVHYNLWGPTFQAYQDVQLTHELQPNFYSHEDPISLCLGWWLISQAIF